MSAEKRAEKVCGRKMKMKHASMKIKDRFARDDMVQNIHTE